MKDYTREPKEDGYRSVHLMYRFAGSATTKYWDKLRIEIQLRTKLQHAWATAVETVDTFTGEDLKFGLGDNDWRRFFRLVGSAHAALEGGVFVQNTPSQLDKLKNEISDIESKLNIAPLLRSWSHVTKRITGVKGGRDYWYLIEIRPSEGKIHIASFSAEERDVASKNYQELELANKGSRNQAVLVSVNSLRNLQKTYPNYFADTQFFLESLASFLGREV
jgi:Region found in RelA / SpoT proteins